MPWVANLGDGVNQGDLPFGLDCNVEIDLGAGRWVAQTLPADRNGIPGVLDLHVMPKFEGRREVSEEHVDGGEEGERREPAVSHMYDRRSNTNVQLRLEDKAPEH